MGVLCDTPEALEKGTSNSLEVTEIVNRLKDVKKYTGINLICLSGGDPLWQNKESLHDLFQQLEANKFNVSVETSGVISIKPYSKYKNVFWVVDYKLLSAGVKTDFHKDNYATPEGTIIKFVVYDEADLAEAIHIYRLGVFSLNTKFTFGLYWGTTKITYSELTGRLVRENMLGLVGVNFQVHKMAEFYDQNSVAAHETVVRAKI
jgi:organic radical activating enzyme